MDKLFYAFIFFAFSFGAYAQVSGSNKVWWGLNTNCAQYSQLEQRSNAQWFSFTNGCGSKIKVHYKTDGGFSVMELEPGETDKSWFLIMGANIKFAACTAKSPTGEDVYFEGRVANCYYHRR